MKISLHNRYGFVVIALGAIATIAAIACWPRKTVDHNRPQPQRQPKPPVTVEYSGRKRQIAGFPERFCEHQSASARNTAAYVVALATGVSKVEAFKTVRECGARVIGPLPPNAFLVETSIFALGKLSVNTNFTAATELLPEDKVDARLKSILGQGAALIDVTVDALAAVDVERLINFADSKGGEQLKGCLNGRSSVTLKLPRALVMELAKRGDVRWIEPFVRPKLLNDKAVEPEAMNVQTAWNTFGLTGNDQVITTSDSGIDTGSLETMHADLKNRVIGFKIANSSKCYSYDADGHGTHTAGSIVGDGTLSDGQIRGTAYGARLWAWFCGGTDGYIYLPDDCADLFRPSDASSACIHSASWGSNNKGAYDSGCNAMDEYVWNHPDFLPVIANGNEGYDKTNPSTPVKQSVGSPATAKNVLSVGATQNLRTKGDAGWGNGNPAKISLFSSRGPCADGRIKPDICAPGNGIASTRSRTGTYDYGIYSNTNYAYSCGTSMSTPLVAGAAALVREWLIDRRGFTNAAPTAALVKAVMTGGAKDVTTPNNDFGWGRIDIGESLYPSNRAVRLKDRIAFRDQSERVFKVTLTNEAPFDAQLVWIDYPALSGAAKTLVNDLDLVVSNRETGAVWHGNGIAGGDHTNNVESVRIAAAAAGEYSVIVRGYDVPYDSSQGGAAALYLRGAFEEDTESPSLSIVDTMPSSSTVAINPGESCDFSVAVSATKGLEISYSWQVDGVEIPEATSNVYRYATQSGDSGNHTINVTVSAEDDLMDTHSWTVAVGGIVYVNASIGDDETATGSTNRPYATISAALTAAIPNATIYVTPGTYAENIAVPTTKLMIISTGGPDVTFIDGMNNGHCYNGYRNDDTLLAGFTLINGYAYYGGGAYYGSLSNCVIRDCVAYYGGGAFFSTLTHCTVHANVAYYYNRYYGADGGGVAGSCAIKDSIVWNNYLYNRSTKTESVNNWAAVRDWQNAYTPTFTYSCTTPSGYLGGTGCIDSDPDWVNSANDDIRLKHTSPCLGTASDGTNMGAWQGSGIRGYTLTATVDESQGCGEVSPTSIFVLEGESATFTASTHHPLVGFETNGVFATNEPIFTWENVQTDGEIVVRYTPTNFYVNGTAGNDANDGWTPESAKRSLHETTVLCGGNDQVLVMPGIYTNFVSWGYRTTVRALKGPTATIIDGESKNQCFEDHWYPYHDGETCTTLIGFTLRNGNATFGGGASYGTLVGCVISNCTAVYGGGAYEATLTNCLVVGNRASGSGGGAYECGLINCTLANNSAAEYGGGAILHDSGYAINTITASNSSNLGYDYGNDVYGSNYWTMIASLSDVDAKFADADNGDWHLTPQSPALNSGSNAYVSVACDLDGTNRIYGARVDIGCYEYCHEPEGWPVPKIAAGATPAQEAAAISNAMISAGFPSATAAAITTQADYAKLATWAEKAGVSASDHAKSDTAIISPALSAEKLLNLTSNDVQISSIEVSTNESSTCMVTLSMPLSKYYDATTADLSLLKAAIGVVGSNSITNDFSADELKVNVEKGDTSVIITVEPPDADAYFLKTRVR